MGHYLVIGLVTLARPQPFTDASPSGYELYPESLQRLYKRTNQFSAASRNSC